MGIGEGHLNHRGGEEGGGGGARAIRAIVVTVRGVGAGVGGGMGGGEAFHEARGRAWQGTHSMQSDAGLTVVRKSSQVSKMIGVRSQKMVRRGGNTLLISSKVERKLATSRLWFQGLAYPLVTYLTRNSK